MRTLNKCAMACAFAFAVASTVPAAAQGSMGGGQSGTMGGAHGGSGGQTSGDPTAGGQSDRGTPGDQDNRSNRQGDLQKFVEKAAISNMAEIQLGQLAQEKAQDPQVKQFAQEMVDQHTKAQSELQQAASASGISLPSSLDSKNQKIHDKLSKLDGANFDREYMKAMVDAHNDARKLLEKRAGKENASSSYRGGASDTGSTAGTSGTTGTSGTSGMSGTSGTSGSTAAGEAGSSGTSSMSGTASSAPASIEQWAATTLPAVEHHLQMAKDLEKQVKNEGKSSSKDRQ